ncbi:Nn.00g090510.m01.CDS01 [Neocucurbitaria sp. VM-36]
MSIPSTRYELWPREMRTTVTIEGNYHAEQVNQRGHDLGANPPRHPSPGRLNHPTSSQLKHPFRSLRSWHSSKSYPNLHKSDEPSHTNNESPSTLPAQNTAQPARPSTNPRSLGRRSLRRFLHTSSLSLRNHRPPHAPNAHPTSRSASELSGVAEEYNEVLQMRHEYLSRRASPLPQEWLAQGATVEAASTGSRTLVGDEELEDAEEAGLKRAVREWGVYHEVLVKSYLPELEGRH